MNDVKKVKKTCSRKKKIFVTILCAVITFIIIGIWVLSVVVYNENFNRRFESYEPFMLYTDDFQGLQRTRHQFPSDKGQMLTGYMYSSGEKQRGIVIIAHGFGGGGHNSYMDCANYFAQNGYYVFAYDATGNDESDGDGVGGLPQGVIDLDYAVSFIEECEEFSNFPIVLFGHSWGAYSVCNVLTYHPEVKAIISVSGFNASSDLFESEGKNQVGKGIYLMLPFVKLHEYIKYGNYALNTAMNGFDSSDTNVMIVHSNDDSIVPIEYGYEKYLEKYKDDSRFNFIRLENRGHDYVFDDMTYINEFNKGFDKWFETLNYDYQAEENNELFAIERTNYILQNLDREEWCNKIDKELFEKFVDFYDAHLE